MADKKGRVAEIIQRNLSEIIIYQMKSPICEFASINQVELTSDYSYCTVYVSHIDPTKADSLVGFLNNNKGKIRSKLAGMISIFKTPELIFVKDELFEKGQKMEKLISDAINKKPKTLKDLEAEDKAKEKKAKKSSTKKTAISKKSAAKKTVKKSK